MALYKLYIRKEASGGAHFQENIFNLKWDYESWSHKSRIFPKDMDP